MQPATLEWIAKAEGDYTSALREFRARKNPNYDASCFHAQQCVEKYMKACLQEKCIRFEKTHDLIRLMSLIPENIVLQSARERIAELSAASVEFRYPGEIASKEDAKNAIATCQLLRTELQCMIGMTKQLKI
jgi:HEPN domain-containing protein